MALLTPQQIGMNTTITPVAAAASNTAVADDRVWFEVTIGATSTGGSLVVPGTQYGQARADVTFSGLTSTTRRFGPLVPDLATDGVVELTLTNTTAVTIALVRI